MIDWKPISDAPTDGTRILLYYPPGGQGVGLDDRIVVGNWDTDEYAKKPKPYWKNDLTSCFGITSSRKSQPSHFAYLVGPNADS